MPSALISTGIQFPDNTVQRRAFPSGGILMWYGNIANIPSGWLLCNGTNGTPDLRDRFVVGAGSSYSIGNTGGSNTVALSSPMIPPHSHPVVSASISPAGNHNHPSPDVVSQGNHSHPVTGITNSGASIHGAGAGSYQGTPVSGPGGGHSHPTGVGANGSHTHTLTVGTGAIGSGTAHENRPPYYALAYIMEVA